VDLLRRMGFEVYYGDATRYDLLLTAGAKEAQIIIIGLPQPEMSLELIETVKKHFPHLHIIARAFDYDDTFDLMDAGVLHIYRDTIRNGLDAAKGALRLLGFRGYELERHSKRFLEHDLQNLKGLAAVRHDEKEYAESVKRAVRDLELQLESQRNGTGAARDIGWDSASLVKDYGA
jgi:Kef-type K+ transport systems, predicted NAD-binding component